MATAADAPTADPDARTDLTDSLRDLADFLDANATIPLPHVWATAMSHMTNADGFRAACEAMLPHGAAVADRKHTDRDVAVTLSFGPIDLAVEVRKSAIGEKRTTVREVTEYALPEWATPREVTT